MVYSLFDEMFHIKEEKSIRIMGEAQLDSGGKKYRSRFDAVDVHVDEAAENGNVNHSFVGEFVHVKLRGEDIFENDLTWIRLILSVLE